ncbi:protein kinase [Candidatus Uabimicrobium sp. HlEnr_7]|uniref:serine/threonine protein kinase n=1 Tax=Candidatus Uabimicrobium helgolandensis TaxID=3095367 RepID=UPI003557C5D6
MIIQRHELAFARRIVRQGLISGEQMLECIKFLRGSKNLSLKEILLRKGYVNEEAIEKIENSFLANEVSKIKEGETTLGSYLLLKKLGEGAMGCVYKAKHTKGGRVVALKILDQELAEDPGFIARFVREAKNAAKLKKHPNIVEAYDIGEYQGKFYFAMELVEGCSLAHIVYSKGKISEKQALIICRQIASALEHAHRFSIVHRDVKPENILYSQEGIVKLCDLGLAKDLSQDIYHTAGITVGTACYASPEQGSKNIDIRTDIYSLGVCLYQMLTANLPTENRHFTIGSDISENTSLLIRKMTAINRKERYQTPTELLQDLKSILQGQKLKFDESFSGEEQEQDPYRKSQIVLTRKKHHFRLNTQHKMLIGSGGLIVLWLILRHFL